MRKAPSGDSSTRGEALLSRQRQAPPHQPGLRKAPDGKGSPWGSCFDWTDPGTCEMSFGGLKLSLLSLRLLHPRLTTARRQSVPVSNGFVSCSALPSPASSTCPALYRTIGVGAGVGVGVSVDTWAGAHDCCRLLAAGREPPRLLLHTPGIQMRLALSCIHERPVSSSERVSYSTVLYCAVHANYIPCSDATSAFRFRRSSL